MHNCICYVPYDLHPVNDWHIKIFCSKKNILPCSDNLPNGNDYKNHSNIIMTISGNINYIHVYSFNY